MPFSTQLEKSLRKGTFPLLSSDGLVLWRELVNALKADFDTAIGEIRALYGHDDEGSFFDDQVKTKAGAYIEVSKNEKHAFLGMAYERLTKDHGMVTSTPAIHALVMDIRSLAVSKRFVAASSVALAPAHAHHGMGTGLTTTNTLTLVPDPAHKIVNNYGSVPDQTVIESKAAAWGIIKKRRHVKQGTGKIGAKPHYVLAHLINHNINGSGAEPLNVVPFSADGNTQMAKSVEADLKAFVQRGAPVRYNIVVGADVGMTTQRQAIRDQCTTAEERAIIDIEAHLPTSLTISLSACDNQGNWHIIHPGTVINNYVPLTVPVI